MIKDIAVIRTDLNKSNEYYSELKEELEKFNSSISLTLKNNLVGAIESKE